MIRAAASRFRMKRAFQRAFSTHYDLLGISKTAQKDEIRKAYLSKAKVMHPDMHPEDKQDEAKAKFQELLEAYETLYNENDRAKYDASLGGGPRTQKQQQEQHEHEQRRRQRPRSDSRNRQYTREELEEELNRLRQEFEREQAEFHSQHGGQPTGKFRERGKEHFKQHMHASGETAGGIAKSFFNLVAGTFLFWLLFKSAGSTKERRRVARQKQRYNDEVVRIYHANRDLAPSVQHANKKKAMYRDPTEEEMKSDLAHGIIPAPPKFGDPNNWNK